MHTYSGRRETEARLRRSHGSTASQTRAGAGPIPPQSAIAGVVSGEFNHPAEMNDAFLDLVGYSRQDLAAGRIHWPDLTPQKDAAQDELAHEEGLRFGACTPY